MSEWVNGCPPNGLAVVRYSGVQPGASACFRQNEKSGVGLGSSDFQHCGAASCRTQNALYRIMRDARQFIDKPYVQLGGGDWIGCVLKVYKY